VAHAGTRLRLPSKSKAEAPCASIVPRPKEHPADRAILALPSTPEARHSTQPQTERRWSQRCGPPKLRAEIPDEAARVRLRRVVEGQLAVAAAPRMSQTFDQYRANQQLIAAQVVALTIAACRTVDAQFPGIPPGLGSLAQHIGESA